MFLLVTFMTGEPKEIYNTDWLYEVFFFNGILQLEDVTGFLSAF